jgi:predicted Rossmann-fold nucleotide-binding protein
LKWAKTSLRDKHNFISPGDLDIVSVVDKPQEAVERILDYERRVGPPSTMAQAFA